MPIHLEYSLSAKCRPEHIWQKFENLDQWAWWNKVIARSKWLEGQPWQKGSRFLLGLAKPAIEIPVEILECQAPAKVGWVGKFYGIRAEH